jgi:hypothetical protein
VDRFGFWDVDIVGPSIMSTMTTSENLVWYNKVSTGEGMAGESAIPGTEAGRTFIGTARSAFENFL